MICLGIKKVAFKPAIGRPPLAAHTHRYAAEIENAAATDSMGSQRRGRGAGGSSNLICEFRTREWHPTTYQLTPEIHTVYI